jgi:hypothetical protein
MEKEFLESLEMDIAQTDANLSSIRDDLPGLIESVKTTQDIEALRTASNHILFRLVLCLETVKATNHFCKHIISTIKESNQWQG